MLNQSCRINASSTGRISCTAAAINSHGVVAGKRHTRVFF
jgi:hypothetical protein